MRLCIWTARPYRTLRATEYFNVCLLLGVYQCSEFLWLGGVKTCICISVLFPLFQLLHSQRFTNRFTSPHSRVTLGSCFNLSLSYLFKHRTSPRARTKWNATNAIQEPNYSYRFSTSLPLQPVFWLSNGNGTSHYNTNFAMRSCRPVRDAFCNSEQKI